MKRDAVIYLTLIIIVILIIVGIFIIKKKHEAVEAKIAKCIAEVSELYIQPGCGIIPVVLGWLFSFVPNSLFHGSIGGFLPDQRL